MTALINTRSGGKTPTRRGDKVECHLDRIPDVFIVENWDDWYLYNTDASKFPAHICTLISRPIADGDPIQLLKSDGTLDTEAIFCSQHKTALDELCETLKLTYRHANPEWREE